jgi:hypothetical protein
LVGQEVVSGKLLGFDGQENRMPGQMLGDAFIEAVGLSKTNIAKKSIEEIKKIINGLTAGVVVTLTCESENCEEDEDEDGQCLDVTGKSISDGELIDFSHFVKVEVKKAEVNYKVKVHFSYTPTILGGSTIHLCPKKCPKSSYVRGTKVQVAFVGSLSFTLGLDLKGGLSPAVAAEVAAEARAAGDITIDAQGTDAGGMDKDTPDEAGISSILPIDPLPSPAPAPGPGPQPDPIKAGGGFSGKIKKNYIYEIPALNCP